MKDVFLITKVLLNGSRSQTASKGNKFKKYFLFVFAFAYLMGFMGYTSYEAIKDLMIFKIEYIYLKLAIMGMFTFYTMQTIIAGLNVLFFSKDVETLLPLPIKENKIVMAKMNVLIISEYLTGLLILAPVLVVYGYMLKLGALYYLLATLGFLLLPVIPVILMSLIVTIIMKFTNIIRNKNVVQYLSIILTIVLVFVIEFLGGTANENVTQEDVANNITSINAIADEYSYLYMPVKPIYEMLMNYNNLKGLESLIQISILSIAVYIVGTNLLAKIYLRIITSLNKSGKKKTKKTIEYKITSARKAFFDRDIKILVRNPNFFLQAFLTPFIMTAFLIGYVVMSFKDIPPADMEFLRGYINEGYAFAILLGVIGMFFAFNFISSTAYSRDGKDAKTLKYLPISYDKQIAYKALPGFVINFILMMIALIGVKIALPTVTLINLAMIFVLATAMNSFNNYLGVIIDLKNPKLYWTHEYAVVKQNFNMFIQMGLLAVQIVAIIYLGYRLQNLNKIAIIVAIAYSILMIMMKLYVKKNAKKLYSKID